MLRDNSGNGGGRPASPRNVLALLWQIWRGGFAEGFRAVWTSPRRRRMKRSRMACLMAGRLGCGGGPPIFFFRPAALRRRDLKEGIGDHGHQSVSVQPEPGSAFEVVEAKFFLQLLMRLFADPSGFDRGGKGLEADIGGKVGHIVFLLAGRPPFADEPDFVARHALHAIIGHAVLMAVSDANATGRKETGQPALRAPPPIDPSPFSPPTPFRRRSEVDPGCCICAAFPPWRGEGHGDVGRIDVLALRQPDRPLETALAQSLTERPAGAVSRIGEDAAKARARGDDAVNLLDRDFRLRPCGPFSSAHELAPSARDRASSLPAGTAAGRPSPGPLATRASARPATDNWPSFQARKHIAARRRPNARPSSATPYRRRSATRRAADHSVGLGKQGLLKRRRIPHPAGDEMMKLVVSDFAVPRRHRLNALAISPADQPRNVDRAHPCARLVPESAHERRKPSIDRTSRSRPWSALRKPTTHESRKTRFENPKLPRLKEICQSSARRPTRRLFDEAQDEFFP